jgi:polyhydroxyalkanoate synthesis regulator phasin
MAIHLHLFSTPRRLVQVAAFAAAFLLPLGIASAQKPNYDAVAKRLEAAVRAGELSSQQAAAMMSALAHEHFIHADKKREHPAKAKNEPQLAELKAHYEGMMKRIEAAVRRGDLSKEEAKKKVELMKREIQTKMKHLRQAQSKKEDPRKQRYDAVLKRVKAAVDRGDLSAEDARKKLQAYRKQLAGEDMGIKKRTKAQNDKKDIAERKRQYMAIEKRVKAALESGRVDEAKAKEHLKKAYLRLFPEKRR